MSPHDEFQELEEQLRRNRPQTEPMPPALKHRMRAQLVEKAEMKQQRFNIGTLGAALGALALLLVPFLFWLWLSSMQEGGPLSAVTAPESPEPTAIPAEASEPAAAAQADWVYSISTFPQAGEVLNLERDTVWVMVGYELNSVEEAELVLRLSEAVDADGGRGVASASSTVARGRGTVTLPLTLERGELGDEAGELSLNVLLRDLTSESERLLYLDFPETKRWPYESSDSATETAGPNAVVMGMGVPEPNEEGRLLVPGVDHYRFTVVVGYDLAEYSEGYVSLGYEFNGPTGSSGGGTSQHVSEREGIVEFVLDLEAEYFNERGLAGASMMYAELAGYDEAADEYVPIYPVDDDGNLRNVRENLQIQSIRLGQDESGEPALIISVWYERKNRSEAAIELTVEDGSETPLAAVSHPISRYQEMLDVIVPLDLSTYTADMLLRVAATLETEEQALLAEVPLLAGSLQGERTDELWFISTETEQQVSVESGERRTQLNVIVGYSLSDAYEGGSIAFTWEQQSMRGGGGNGGGERQIEPGTGTVSIPVPLSQPVEVMEGSTWPEGVWLRAELRGRDAAGTTATLFTLEQP